MIKYLENDFKKEIENKKILVDFYANWCGPCKMFAEVLQNVEKEIDIDILKVDVDKFPEIAKEYAVLSIPTIYLFDNLQVIKKQVGYLNPNELMEFVNKK